jgi:hypothetical protein
MQMKMAPPSMTIPKQIQYSNFLKKMGKKSLNFGEFDFMLTYVESVDPRGHNCLSGPFPRNGPGGGE